MATRSIPRTDLGASHEGFLRHRGFLWLKVALALSLLALTGYALIDVQPRPNGGSAYGYTLGTIGVLLIPPAPAWRRTGTAPERPGSPRPSGRRGRRRGRPISQRTCRT